MMNDNQNNLPVGATPVADDDEISLLDLAIVLAKHKKMILGLPAVAALLALIVSFLLSPVFTSSTAILPPQQSQSAASALLGQLGGLASMAGAAAGIKNPSDLYVGMLQSRTVADALIERFDLVAHYEQEYISKTREKLEKRSTISAGKDGIIRISVDDEDPVRATEMAKAYVEELAKLTDTLAVTSESQKRLFFERQMIEARDNLVRAEMAARSAMDQGGLASIDAQGRALIEVTARLRGQISVKEVEIGAMRSFAGPENPQLRAAQQELVALRAELARIEGTTGTARSNDSGGVAGAENLQLLRNVKYYETLYEMLAKQFELAKIEEAKGSALIQVLDEAVVPDRKSKPKRALIVVLVALVAGFFAVLLAFIREAGERARQDPESAERLSTFRRYLAWRS